jgi:D-alanyl-D-alanine dipeptidase
METPWTSFETMRREDELYRRVVFVEHNTGPAVGGGGSCIFLHVWRGPDSVTSGCTAMELAPLEEVVRFIDPDHTVLVQLPEAELEALRSVWGLPD